MPPAGILMLEALDDPVPVGILMPSSLPREGLVKMHTPNLRGGQVFLVTICVMVTQKLELAFRRRVWRLPA